MSILDEVPLLRRLIETHGMPYVEGEMPTGLHLLLLPSHGRAHLETPDIAAVLPDLLRLVSPWVGGNDVSGAVAGPDLEKRLVQAQAATGAAPLSLPALIVMEGSRPVGTIARMRDWDDYRNRLAAILAPYSDASIH